MGKAIEEHDTSFLELMVETGAISQLEVEETEFLWGLCWESWHKHEEHIPLGDFMATLKAWCASLRVPMWAEHGIDQEATA